MTANDNYLRGMAVARNTLLNLFGQAIPVLIGVIALPVIVRGLGTDRFGLLGLGWVVFGYFQLLDLGTSRAATRFASEALGRNAPHEVPGIIWAAVAIQGAFGIAGSLLLWATTPFLVHEVLRVSPALTPESLATFRVLAVAIPIVLVSASFRGGLESAQRFDLVNLVSIPGGALNFLIPLGGVLAGWGLTPILWLLVAARAATLVGYAVFCSVLYPGLYRPAPSWAALRNLLPFGMWVTVSGVVSPILDQLDRLLLGAWAGLSSVGYYTAPQEIALRVRIIPSAMATSLFPAFAGANEQYATRVPRYYAAAIRLLAVALTPIAVGTVFLSRDLLQLWLGPEIAVHSAAALQWLAIGVVMNSIAYIPSGFLHGVNRPDLPAKFHLLELPAFLLVAWALMPRWGAAGAGAAWALRAAADAGLLLVAASRRGATRGVPVLTTPAIGWAALAAATLALGFVASGAALAIPVRAAAAFVAASTVFVTAWFGVLSQEERSYLVATFRSLQGIKAPG